MKKHLFLGFIGLLMFVTPSYANGDETLIPNRCNIENSLVYEPINEVSIAFIGSIAVAKDAKAIITCGNKTMATGAITSYDYHTKDSTEGFAIITFDNIVLPKGKSYKLEIPSGAIYLKENPAVKTGNLKIDFKVPEKITGAECSVKNGSYVNSEQMIWFYYRTETEPIGKPTMTLYREGVPVRTFEAHVGWDWNLGQAYVDFGTPINFERDVHYSVVMPEGSLSPRFRTDITNEEARVDFIGGYTEPADSITYVWCSLYDQRDSTDVLGEVRFFYDRPIMLSPNPKIQLFDTDDNLIKEVTPTLTEENGKWVVFCDFGGVKIPNRGCNIVIPEGTIISANGNVAVNSKNKLGVNVFTEVGKVSTNDIKVKISNLRVIIDNAPINEMLTVYSTDGKKVVNHLISSPYFTFELPSKGVYIISINRKSLKVATQR